MKSCLCICWALLVVPLIKAVVVGGGEDALHCTVLDTSLSMGVEV